MSINWDGSSGVGDNSKASTLVPSFDKSDSRLLWLFNCLGSYNRWVIATLWFSIILKWFRLLRCDGVAVLSLKILYYCILNVKCFFIFFRAVAIARL